MRARTGASRADLDQRLAAAKAEIATLRARQSATARVLQAIATAPDEARRTLGMIAESACALCSAYDAVILLRRDNVLTLGAHHGPIPMDFAEFPISPGWTAGRSVVEKRPVHVDDLWTAADEFPDGAEMARRLGHRTTLSLPMLSGGEAIGSITLRRFEVKPFSDDEVDLLTTFADQAAIAIANARLFEEVQARTVEVSEALQQQTATADVLKAIAGSAFDLDAVLCTLVKSALALCRASGGNIHLRDGDVFRPAMQVGWPPEFLELMKRNPIKPDMGSVSGRAVMTASVVRIPDVLADPLYALSAGQKIAGYRSVLGVPLIRDGEVVGVFSLGRDEVDPFTDREAGLVQMFSDQAVIAIENARLFDELRESLQQQTATADVLKAISRSTFDLPVVLSTLIEAAVRLCEADQGTIARERSGVFQRVASHGFSPEFMQAVLDKPVEVERGSATGRALAEGRTVHIADVDSDPDYTFAEAKALGGFRTILAIPMLRDDRAIGVLALTRHERRPFTEKQIELLAGFADQAAIAIENVRLFEAVQARTAELTEALHQQTATSEVLSVISRSTTDLQPVLDSIALTAVRLCEADYTHIYKLADDGYYYLAAAKGVEESYSKPLFGAPFRPDRGSLAARAALERRTVHIPNIPEDPDYTLRIRKQRSGLGVPLLQQGVPVGVIVLLRTEIKPFTDRQIELVTTFADQAVIAIENARLFGEVEARTNELTGALEEQTATSEVLKVISSSPGDLEPVFQAMLTNAMRICDAPSGILFEHSDGAFRAISSLGVAPVFDEFCKERRVWGPHTGLGQIVRTRQPAHINDIREQRAYAEREPNRVAAVEMSGMRTIVVVPMLKERELIGAFSLYRQEVRAFTEKQVALVTSFAAQAVIAIENARLFTELEARNRELSEALEQQTATSAILRVIASSPTDLAPVLSAVAENAARLCGADDAQIFRVQGDMLTLEASYGSIPIYFREQKISRDWVTGRSVVDRRTIHVHDLAAEPAEEFPLGRQMQRQHGHHTTLATPLLKQGNVLGAILIRRMETQPFSDEQIRLLETFAAQAAIAVENVRLFTELEARTRELQEALERQTASGEILRTISSSPGDVRPVFETIVECAARLCKAEFSAVVQFDGALLHLAAVNNMSPEETAAYRTLFPRPPTSGFVIGRAFLAGHPVHVKDVSADPDYDPRTLEILRRAAPYRTYLGVPILLNGSPIGAIGLGRRAVRPFTGREIALVETFADQAVIAIENARLFEALESAVAEFNAVLDNIDYGVLFMDRDLRARVVNPALRRLWDVPQDVLDRRPTLQELLEYNRDRGVYTTSPEKWDEWVAARVQRIRDGNIAPGEFTRADGKVYTYQCVALPDGGRMLSYFDITELKNRQAELMAAKEAAEKALADLRTAQERLVHTEKLASLGQLTAGIAHEIKNPLNFVNNFASLSSGLLTELEAMLAAPIKALEAADREDVEDLLRTVRDNLGKIVHHGRRADSIVRNMLLHARHGSGEWRSADINAIAEEALNLAYHGARAGHPDFNVEIVKHLDPAAGAIDCCPQDVMRVILNLVSNGIYAANMKRASARPGFVPRLDVTTGPVDSGVAIEVRDNGTGIPAEIRASVFLPFFTTKPAGEGTGLGLSLSHDIVVKQHNGSFSVESEPGEFTSFRVVLPRHGGAEGRAEA